jgi:hypothetical protein
LCNEKHLIILNKCIQKNLNGSAYLDLSGYVCLLNTKEIRLPLPLQFSFQKCFVTSPKEQTEGKSAQNVVRQVIEEIQLRNEMGVGVGFYPISFSRTFVITKISFN